MPPKNLLKGSQEMKDYMAMIRAKKGMNGNKKSMKKGKGIVSDVYNKTKDMLVEEGKNQLVNVIDQGANVIKRKIRGKGLFGNVLKSVSSNLIDTLPGPGFIKTGLKYGADKLIDKTGAGVKVKNNNKKIKNNNKMLVGNGLMPSGY